MISPQCLGTAGRIVDALQMRCADCRFKEPDVRAPFRG